MPKEINITQRITAKAFEILEQNPEGISWTELRKQIEASDSSLHPKTVNGIIWKLPEKHSDLVYKSSKGIFRLLKYKNE